ncbi:hypothetical protein P5G86_22045 [Paenibacillus jamilae]|uniref:hypothetical protein n=1 Tax=Bacillus cereus group TaxID=86661 RepID=UPI00188F0227|nr:hypothetical protein [Bacillus thuringiensis]MEB4842680.1 hypothetical protein [Paenibacillus jamilae]MEB8835587.1 hypothetical protein [Bacillus cereus]MCR6856276.1 hypothetical protein [Bacillus thuringiensis]MEB9279881.1 hypothetical protein [Bacillus cereus]MEC3036784.1 hypothetical protein [Bacillus cereus]
MNPYQNMSNDESGIKSLSGFAYQIRVFVYYMSKMIGNNQQIEFETLEDVVVNNTKVHVSMDEKSDSFRSLLRISDGYYAIQVKRTKINVTTKKKLLFNWLLIESKNSDISKYILYTEDEYGNTGELFDISHQELYEEVINSTKKSNALISKVKSEYINDPERFEKAYKKVEAKYKFVSEQNLNNKILNGFALHFRRSGISDLIFALRVKELIINITGDIIASVDNKRPYVCTFQQMMQKIEDISNRIKEEYYEPDYMSFKKARSVNLSDQSILHSREYLQLLKCNLSEKRIEEHLIYQQYYESIKYRLLEDNKLNVVENIENTTYDNFCSVKEELEADDDDSPIKRLNGTKKMDNSYVRNNQTRYGSCIYLTKDDIDEEIKISWEDGQ